MIDRRIEHKLDSLLILYCMHVLGEPRCKAPEWVCFFSSTFVLAPGQHQDDRSLQWAREAPAS